MTNLQEAAHTAFHNAIENGYKFKCWTAEMLADDMLAYDSDVEEACKSEHDRAALIVTCEKLLKDGANSRPACFIMQIVADRLSRTSSVQEDALATVSDLSLDTDDAAHFILESMPRRLVERRVIEMLSEEAGGLGILAIFTMKRGDMDDMVRALKDDLHDQLAKGKLEANKVMDIMTGKENGPSEGADPKQEK